MYFSEPSFFCPNSPVIRCGFHVYTFLSPPLIQTNDNPLLVSTPWYATPKHALLPCLDVKMKWIDLRRAVWANMQQNVPDTRLPVPDLLGGRIGSPLLLWLAKRNFRLREKPHDKDIPNKLAVYLCT